jgi:hypothetical protein
MAMTWCVVTAESFHIPEAELIHLPEPRFTDKVIKHSFIVSGLVIIFGLYLLIDIHLIMFKDLHALK